MCSDDVESDDDEERDDERRRVSGFTLTGKDAGVGTGAAAGGCHGEQTGGGGGRSGENGASGGGGGGRANESSSSGGGGGGKSSTPGSKSSCDDNDMDGAVSMSEGGGGGRGELADPRRSRCQPTRCCIDSHRLPKLLCAHPEKPGPGSGLPSDCSRLAPYGWRLV